MIEIKDIIKRLERETAKTYTIETVERRGAEVINTKQTTFREHFATLPMEMADEILASLKRLEPKAVEVIYQNSECKNGLCPSCGMDISTTLNPRYCGFCGQVVTWDA